MSQIKKALDKARQERGLDQELFQLDTVGVEPAGSIEPVPIKQPHRWDDPGTKRDIENPTYTRTRVIELSEASLINNRIFSVKRNDIVADQYKHLRTQVIRNTRGKGHNCLAITSFKDGEGKTLTSVNLAITLAQESRHTVLLVDADLRRPSVARVLGLPPLPGLHDYLKNGSSLEELLVHPGIEALTVLPAGDRAENSTELIGSHKMETLVREMKHRYPDRYILFDTPALSQCPDALVLASYLDGIILVARSGYTRRKDISSSINLMKDQNVLGIVMNEGAISAAWAY